MLLEFFTNPMQALFFDNLPFLGSDLFTCPSRRFGSSVHVMLFTYPPLARSHGKFERLRKLKVKIRRLS